MSKYGKRNGTRQNVHWKYCTIADFMVSIWVIRYRNKLFWSVRREGSYMKCTKANRWMGKLCKWIVLLGLFALLGIAAWKEIVTDGLARQIPESEEWNLVVVNEWNELPEDFETALTLTELSNGQKVDARVYPYLQQMFDAMRAENIYPTVREGYRTQEEQQKILDERIARYIEEGLTRRRAEKAARQYVALPGYSEHHLGSAVDINADTSMSTNEDVYQWLAKNAYKYGFILRYSDGKEEITGICYEPWHYRFVGVEAAKEIYDAGICLEEYVAGADGLGK